MNTFLTGNVSNTPSAPNHKFTHQKMCGKPSSQMSSLQSWFPTAMLPRNWIPHRSAAKGESHILIYLPVTLHRAERLETHHHKCHLNLLMKSWGVRPKSQRIAWYSLDLCEDINPFIFWYIKLSPQLCSYTNNNYDVINSVHKSETTLNLVALYLRYTYLQKYWVV